MTSPYIQREAERLGIGSHADHNHNDFHFIRQRPDRLYVPLERSEPMQSWTRVALGGIGVVGFMIASFYAMDALAAVCQATDWCA